MFLHCVCDKKLHSGLLFFRAFCAEVYMFEPHFFGYGTLPANAAFFFSDTGTLTNSRKAKTALLTALSPARAALTCTH